MNAINVGFLLSDSVIGWEFAKIILAAAVGFFLGICKDKCMQDKRKLSCKASYCPVGRATEFRFMISHVGNATVENVRMRLRCAAAEKIGHFFFCVDEEVKCDRLSVDERRTANSVSCTWAYINPGDDLELIVAIQDCARPDEVTLEIDGKSTTIARKKLTMQCGC